MGDECPFCNEPTLSWEGFGNFEGDCAGSRVCTSCGGVVDENNLTADEGIHSTVQTGSYSYVQTTAKERQQYNVRCGAPSVAKGRRQGLDLTKRIAQYMDCTSSMTAEAVALFERLVGHEHFRGRRIVAKMALAACSVYIICRQHNWPVMLGDMCGMVDQSVYFVDFWKRHIMTIFPDLADVRSPDLCALLEARCKKASVSNEVQQTAVAIIKLCRDLWITEGRKKDNIVIPALFIAWQSEDPVYRAKVKLRSFCRDHQLSLCSRATVCLCNMQQTLCQLAEKIPWVTASCNSITNVAFHVKDIINYRSTLIAEARSEILRMQDADDDSSSEKATDSKHSDVTSKSLAACTPEDIINYRSTLIAEARSEILRMQDADDDSSSEKASESIHSDVTRKSLAACTPEVSTIGADDPGSKATVSVHTDGMVFGDTVASQYVTTVKKESTMKSNGHSVKRAHADYYDSFWPPPGYKPYKSVKTEEAKLTVEHPDLDCAHLSTHDIPDEDMHLYLRSTAEQMFDVLRQ